MRSYKLPLAFLTLAILVLVSQSLRATYYGANISYTFNNASEKRVTLKIVTYVPNRRNPLSPTAVTHSLRGLAPHKRADGAKAIIYDPDLHGADFTLRVYQGATLLEERPYFLSDMTNHPPDGSAINFHTEKIFVSVLQNQQVFFVITHK